MKPKKYIAIALTALLTFGSAQTALAKVIYHDISKGNLEISQTTDDTYEVTGSTTTYSIIVKDRVVTHIVLNGVNIETTDKNGIKIGSKANVVLEIQGENHIGVSSTVDDEPGRAAQAAINITDGTLTIRGDKGDKLTVETLDSEEGFADAAAIGGNENEPFSGVINIEGGNIIATSEEDAAAIGSGYDGEMSGTITISGGEVTASSNDDGAGIGSGDDGKMSGTGTITISGGKVTASSNDDGAGIGAGYYGEMSGTITISGGEVTASSDDNGAGIGAGDYGEMSGSITISGGEVTASSNCNSAGIGSGWEGEMSGTITISGGEVTASSDDNGAGIGSGWDGEMSGTITISGGEVTASSYYFGAGIGAGDFGDITESGSITIGGDATVTANSELGLGIGSGDYGNMNGTITITDDAKVDITLGDTSNNTGIGAGEISSENPYYKFNGSINILEHANVNMIYSDPYDPDYEGVPNIGSINPDSTGGITLSTGATINGTQASDVEALKELGILNDNAVTTTVEPTPEPVEPEVKPDSRNTYSLKQLNLVQRINEAEGGEVVAVSEKQLSKGKLPAYALEALAKKENVTLAILCEKFDILIPSEDAVADAGSTQFYTIDELVEMYE